MIGLRPVCAGCFDLMPVVRVCHPNGRVVDWPVCPNCLTCRHLDQTDLPIDTVAPQPVRHLRAVP